MKESVCTEQENNKALIVRLNRISGQIDAIRKLLESNDGCVCMDLLNQIRSATCAMRGVWEIVAAKHLEDCITNMPQSERNQVIEKIVSCLKELR